MFESTPAQNWLADKIFDAVERVSPLFDTINRVCYAVGSSLWND